jgi:hypothetical protein
MADRKLKIEQLRLDLENPRIVKAGSQREALQQIIVDQDVRLAALGESIITDGLNPMDRLLVIKSTKERGKFTVLEGNRRLACMTLLSNPAVMTDLEVRPHLQRRFEKLAIEFDAASIEPIDCFELKTRAEGAPWITQRHTGANGGRGIVDWNGVATARFRGTDPALQAMDLVLKHGGLTEDEREEVLDRFPITTLDRLLSTPAVRVQIGVEIKSQKLLSELPPEEVMKPLRRMVMDLASGAVNVTALKKRDQMIDYAASLGDDLPDLSKKSGTATAVEALGDSDFAPPPPPPPQPGPAPAPPKPGRTRTYQRKALIPRDCSLSVSNHKIAEIEKELRALVMEKNPHAISVLFRVFLELSVDHYMDKKGLPSTTPTPNGDKDKKLREKVKAVVDHLDKAGVPKKHLDGISKGIDDKNSPLYVDTLHNYVHNRFFSPQERDLKVSWDNSQLFFESIWK